MGKRSSFQFPNGFWTGTPVPDPTRTDKYNPQYDPKTQFRWIVRIPGFTLEDNYRSDTGPKPPGFGDANSDLTGDLVWYAKSIDKPSIAIENLTGDKYMTDGARQRPNLLAQSPQFKPITMTLIDPTYPNAARKLVRMIRRGGYHENVAQAVIQDQYAGDSNRSYLNTNVAGDPGNQSGDVFPEISIEQLDSYGDTQEKWTLVDAYLASVDFGKLDYSSNDLVEITCTWGFRTLSVFFPALGGEDEYLYFRNTNELDKLGSSSFSGET